MLTRRRTIMLASAFAAVLAASALVAISLGSAQTSTSSAASPASGGALHGARETNALLRGIPQNGTVLGRPDAPVTIVEYADMQCPYCARWAIDVFPSVVREFVRSGKAKIEFRGLTFVGPDSEPALRTALAAGRSGRLWHVVDVLYHNQGAENTGWVTDDLLERAVASSKLDAERTLDARDDASVQLAMEKAAAAATNDRVPGTPALSVGPTGGTLTLLTSNDIDTLRSAISQALAA
jgi:protein-disulfide isomerase